MGWLFFPNLGPLVVAIVVLPALFILRSLLVRGRGAGTSSPRTAPRGLLIVFGILLGTAVSIAWWRLFEQLTLASGDQDFIFGRKPYGSGYYPGTLSSRIEFARSFLISAVAYLLACVRAASPRWLRSVSTAPVHRGRTCVGMDFRRIALAFLPTSRRYRLCHVVSTTRE